MSEIECKIHDWLDNGRDRLFPGLLAAARVVIFNEAMMEAGGEQRHRTGRVRRLQQALGN